MSSWHGVLKELAQILKTLKHMQQKNSYRLIYTCYSAVSLNISIEFLKTNTERKNVKNLTYITVFTIRTTNNDPSVIIQQNKLIGKSSQEVFVKAKNLLDFILPSNFCTVLTLLFSKCCSASH